MVRDWALFLNSIFQEYCISIVCLVKFKASGKSSSKCVNVENILPKNVDFSVFICRFAMSVKGHCSFYNIRLSDSYGKT